MRYKILMKDGIFVNENLLHKGRYLPTDYLNNLNSCELVDVELKIQN